MGTWKYCQCIKETFVLVEEKYKRGPRFCRGTTQKLRLSQFTESPLLTKARQDVCMKNTGENCPLHWSPSPLCHNELAVSSTCYIFRHIETYHHFKATSRFDSWYPSNCYAKVKRPSGNVRFAGQYWNMVLQKLHPRGRVGIRIYLTKWESVRKLKSPFISTDSLNNWSSFVDIT